MSRRRTSPAMQAIDRLKRAANLTLMKKEVTLSNGEVFEFWHKPLVAAEREKAQKNAKSGDATAYAMQLLIMKACDETGQKLFQPGHAAELKHEVRDSDLQALMLAVINDPDPDSDEGADLEPIDPKS